MNCLYQMNEEECKGEFGGSGSLPVWCWERRKIWSNVTTITAFGLASPGGAKEACHTHPATGNILIHLIFSTQGHRPLIKPDLRDDLFAYIGGIIREMPGTALIINGTSDHVHMLVRIRPAQSSAEIARVVKTNSSRWVREKWSKEFAWQTDTASSA